MARLIRKLTFDRVDVVDKGANHDKSTGEGSHILLLKRDAQTEHTMTEQGAWNKIKAVFKRAGLSDVELAEIEQSVEPPAPEKKKDDAMTEQEIAKRIEDATKVAVDAALAKQADELKKKADEAAADRIAKAEAEAKAASELAKRVADERDLAKFEAEIRAAYPHLTLDPVKDNSVLKELSEKLPEVAKRVVEILKSANENLRLSKVLASVNADGSPTYSLSSTYEKMEAKAREYMAKGDCTTLESGMALVAKREPDLTAAYQRETQERVRKYSAA